MAQGFGVWSKRANPFGNTTQGDQKYEPFCQNSAREAKSPNPFTKTDSGMPAVRALVPKQTQGDRKSEPFRNSNPGDVKRMNPFVKAAPGKSKVKL